MSTNNFKWENILIVAPDFSVQNGEGFDEYAYDEYIDDLKIQFEKIGFESCDKWVSGTNYDGKIIASFGLQDENDLMVKYIEVVVRSGYYAGNNVDYIIDGEFDEEHNKKLDKKFDKMVEKTEKLLRKYGGKELIQLGSFSNGEGIYQEIKRK